MFRFCMMVVALICFTVVADAKDILVGGAFSCESTQAMRIDPWDEEYQNQPKQTFTFLVDAQKVSFLAKGGGFVHGVTLGKKYHQPHLLSAYDYFTSFSLERKQNGQRFRFHYTWTAFSRSYVMFGYCKKY